MSNPYEYHEESLPERQADEGTWHEPCVPIVLRMRRGLFGGIVTLEATRDQCEIFGASLPESIVVLRDKASEQMRLKSGKLIVRTGDGRKYSFRYLGDKYQALSLARLETWRRQRGHAVGAYESVLKLLKKNAIRPAMLRVIDLTVIQLVLLLILLITSATDMLRRDHEIVIFIRAFPTMVTFALALLLWMRQIWAVWITIVLSFFPLLLSLLLFLALPGAKFDEGETAIEIAYIFIMMALGLLYAPVVIVSCSCAIDRYYTLKAELKKYQGEYQIQPSKDQDEHQLQPSNGGLFDKNNRITITFKQTPTSGTD